MRNLNLPEGFSGDSWEESHCQIDDKLNSELTSGRPLPVVLPSFWLPVRNRFISGDLMIQLWWRSGRAVVAVVVAVAVAVVVVAITSGFLSFFICLGRWVYATCAEFHIEFLFQSTAAVTAAISFWFEIIQSRCRKLTRSRDGIPLPCGSGCHLFSFRVFFLFSQFFWCLLIQPTVKCFGFLMILMIFNSFGFWIWFGSTQRRRWRQQQSNSNSKRKESRAAAGQREREKSPPPPPPPPTATPSSGQLNNYCNML